MRWGTQQHMGTWASMSSKYNWVHHNGTKLYDIGILGDGELYNPRRYPEELVREAVLAADERKRQRRSARAQKAAVTRRRRQELWVYEVARRIVAGGRTGPALKCCIC